MQWLGCRVKTLAQGPNGGALAVSGLKPATLPSQSLHKIFFKFVDMMLPHNSRVHGTILSLGYLLCRVYSPQIYDRFPWFSSTYWTHASGWIDCAKFTSVCVCVPSRVFFFLPQCLVFHQWQCIWIKAANSVEWRTPLSVEFPGKSFKIPAALPRLEVAMLTQTTVRKYKCTGLYLIGFVSSQ